MVVNLVKPANFRRSLIQENKMNKINILVKPQWVTPRLSDHCSSKSFLDSYKAFYDAVQRHIIQLANTLTQPSDTCQLPRQACRRDVNSSSYLLKPCRNADSMLPKVYL
ncbi:hypothetical protein OK016_23860 [Vibrio chagasii]|nr:hypothetical protein [Vibrio chagasii]